MPTEISPLPLRAALPICPRLPRRLRHHRRRPDPDGPQPSQEESAHQGPGRSEEHTSELQSLRHLACRPRSPLFPYAPLSRSALAPHDAYATTDDDPTRMVPNPAKKKAHTKVLAARARYDRALTGLPQMIGTR